MYLSDIAEIGLLCIMQIDQRRSCRENTRDHGIKSQSYKTLYLELPENLTCCGLFIKHCIIQYGYGYVKLLPEGIQQIALNRKGIITDDLRRHKPAHIIAQFVRGRKL